MTSRRDIILIGAKGHARVLIDVLRRSGHQVAAAVDADPALHGRELDGVPIIGGDDAVSARAPSDVVLVNAVGNVARIGDSGLQRRKELFELFVAKGYAFMKVISSDAVVSSAAVCRDACQVITGAIIHPGVVIGANAVINTGARVDHDCQIGDHAHIAPGAVLCGGVRAGPQCHIGAGAVVIAGVSIGAGAVVGAGAIVAADVSAGETILSPAGQVRPR